MTAKKRTGGGRVTPKGTVNPSKPSKKRHTELPESLLHPPAHLQGNAGRPNHRASRPVSHNQGNR